METRLTTALIVYALLQVTPALGQTTAHYREIAVENGGAIEGHTSFAGRVPAPLQLLITKDMEICGEGYRERIEVDASEDMDLRGVVVFIEEIASGKPWSARAEEHAVNQKSCFFRPHVQVVPRGSQMDIVNSDSTLHNIHAYELIGRARRSLFNISQPEMGPVPQALQPVRGNRISLECDSHDFMQGWIFAADHPYATVVDESGHFTIGDIPPGNYVLSAWHPRLGTLSREVTVEAGATIRTDFEYRDE